MNAIIKLQHLPNQWKSAIIIAILKPGKDPKVPHSYRPIALSKLKITSPDETALQVVRIVGETRDGLSEYLAKLIGTYLVVRTFQVKIDGTLSNPQQIEAEVPQGTVLAPQLYPVHL